jgi:hypothetical protein
MRVGWFDYVRTNERPALENPERALCTCFLPLSGRAGLKTRPYFALSEVELRADLEDPRQEDELRCSPSRSI